MRGLIARRIRTFARAPQQNRVADQQRRRWTECCRTGPEEIRLAGRTHRRQERTLLVFRTSSFLGHGGVHRPRQPASHLRRRHHRRSLRLQRLHGAAERANQQQHRATQRRDQAASLQREMQRRRPGNYADGSPKRWWSKLAVVDNGQEVEAKEIVVNDPLVHQGLRFYQASFGGTGKLAGLKVAVTPDTGGAIVEMSRWR